MYFGGVFWTSGGVLYFVGGAGTRNNKDTMHDVSDIFYFFLLGEGEGGARGAGRGGGGGIDFY